jgi:transposase
MTDDATTAPLIGPSYDGRKSGSGGRAGRGVEVRVREVRRRNWSTEERLRIVRETLEPGVIVQAVADRHGVSTGQLYTWRKQMLATAMAGFVPVEGKRQPVPAGDAVGLKFQGRRSSRRSMVWPRARRSRTAVM